MKFLLIPLFLLISSASYAEPNYDDTISFIEQKVASYEMCKSTRKTSSYVELVYEKKMTISPRTKCSFDVIKTENETTIYYNPHYPNVGPEINNTKQLSRTYKYNGIVLGDLNIEIEDIHIDKTSKTSGGENGSLRTVFTPNPAECGWDFTLVTFSLGEPGIPEYLQLDDGSWKEVGTASNWSLAYYDKNIAQRVYKAMNHAIGLCKEPF